MSDVIWGSVTDHQRELLPVSKKQRRRCPYCPKDSGRKITHLGAANGVALMSGCEWHVRMWVKDPRRP